MKNINLFKWFNFFTEFKLYAPIAIIYFTEVSGSFALGMSVFSIVMVSSALFEIPTGVFSDRIGRKKTLILGALAAITFSIFYAIGQSFWILVIGALFEGLARSFYSGNNDALLYDTLATESKQHEYDEFLGRISSMFQVALAISAVLGGIVATWSFPLIMWLSVVPQVLCCYLAFKIVEPRFYERKSGNIFIHLKDAYINFIKNRKLRLLSLSHILGYGFGQASHDFRAAFYGTLWPVWAIGLIRAVSNILASFSFHYSGRVLKRYNVISLFIVDNLFSRIVNTFSTLFPTVLSPIFMSSTALFYGVTTVGRNALMQKEFTDEQRATMGSLNSFVGSIFFGVVAFSIGYMADIFTPAKALLIFQILQLGNLWVYWKLFKNHSDN